MKAVKNHEKRIREPLFHVVKRASIPLWKSLLIRVLAVAAAIALCSLLSILLIGANPIDFVKTMVDGAFGSERRLWKFAKDAAVLLCIALAITPAFRMRFWNIGAEGQTLIGALASVAVAFYLGGKVPEVVLVALMLVSSVLAGAIWGGLPALFKAKWGTNETLFTLMMNYIATGLVSYCLLIWAPGGSSILGRLDHGHLPVIFHEYLLLIAVVLIATVLMFIYLRHTKQGYEISVVGESENTARYIGISVGKVVVRTMIVSGAICGLAGFLIVGALDHSIATTTVGGMGFTAIMVSWLAKFNPFVMVATSFLMIFLQQGADQVVSVFRINDTFTSIVTGIILFAIIGCEFFINYRVIFRSKEVKK